MNKTILTHKMAFLNFCVSIIFACGCSDKGTNKIDASSPEERPIEDRDVDNLGLEDAIAKAKSNGGTVVGLGADGKEESVSFGKLLSEDGSYAVKLANRTSLIKERKENLLISVTPKSGYKMNKDFPTQLLLECGDNLELPKKQLSMKDAESWTEKEGLFSVGAVAKRVGEHSCSGQFKFAVCTETTCDPKKANISFVVNAK